MLNNRFLKKMHGPKKPKGDPICLYLFLLSEIIEKTSGTFENQSGTFWQTEYFSTKIRTVPKVTLKFFLFRVSLKIYEWIPFQTIDESFVEF